MTDLIRQNLGKSTLNLRTLCLAFVIITVRSVVSAEDACSVDGFIENYQQRLCLHYDKIIINKHACCVAIKCPKGNEVKLCTESDPASTACVECKPGTFQTSSFESCYGHSYGCERHAVCARGSRVFHKGNSTSNTVCVCSLELGFFGSWPNCYTGKTCGPGLQLSLEGSCESCPQNFYKASDDMKQCIPCSVCDKSIQNIQSNCTKTQDTVCSNSSVARAGGVSVDVDVVDVQVARVLIPVLVVLVIIIVVLTALALCYKFIYKDKARDLVGTPSTDTSVSSGISDVMFQGTDNFADAEAKALLIGRTEGPISTGGHCQVRNCGHKDPSLSCTASQLGANQQTPFLPPEHTSDVGETDDVSYEVEVENSEQHGAQQIPKTNVNMNGNMNIYGEYVVVHINNKASDNT